MKKALFSILIFTLFLQSCKKNESKCDYDPCTNKAPASEIANLQAYISANSITATQHCSGVFYNIETIGTDKSPNPCSNISFKYKGYLTNGNVFDQQTTPVDYSLGRLVPAWRNVLPMIKAGGRMVIYVPPSLGYGSQDYGSIPGNSILIFEVDLVAVQ
ncbi:FKBP-type peptidyl-prolyl cis-trans isomerase [Terrimonas alba]|uniref:FKBP-type peptidyl-prolyl cis-trans isomerase n=1 Tax=Terrimonas alba TaxID=3349636 RepID=UPI0035F3090F